MDKTGRRKAKFANMKPKTRKRHARMAAFGTLLLAAAITANCLGFPARIAARFAKDRCQAAAYIETGRNACVVITCLCVLFITVNIAPLILSKWERLNACQHRAD